MPIWEYILRQMPRASATSDIFSAIAEPRRRQIIDVLSDGKPIAVGELVETLGLPQPTVSKHLSVLREVGIVSVSRRGQHRLYQLEAKELKPVHEWVKTFEHYWTHQLDRIKQRAEQKARERSGPATYPRRNKEK